MADINLYSTIIIKNMSNRIIDYIPKGQNFVMSIKPYNIHQLQVSDSNDILYYLQQTTDDLKVSQVADNFNSNADLIIKIPATITITNISDKSQEFVFYKENFGNKILPGDAIELTAKTAEEVLYYLCQSNITLQVSQKPEDNNEPDIPTPPNYNLFEFSDINSKECALIKINKNSPLYDNGGDLLEIPDTYKGKKVTRIGNGINPLLSDDWTIKGLAIPDSVIRIEKDAFKYWKVLKNVWLGSGIESIGEGAFTGGNNLLTWEMTATTPPLLESYALGDYKPAKIYVPAESLELYKASPYFKNIADRIVSK